MRKYIPHVVLLAFLAAWVYANQHVPFFWDTAQLGSKHAHFFYENGLRWNYLPESIDSGHPPVFGYYLALTWAVFGKTLPVSHWAMFPFLFGSAWLLVSIGRRLSNSSLAFWLIPIMLLDPVFAGQSALVSPDIALICFFLLAIEGQLNASRIRLALGVLGLCAISMRGMMTAGALFCWVFLEYWPGWRQPTNLARHALPFLPGFAFAGWFLWWHYAGTDWLGFHPNSPWAPTFERVSLEVFFRNVLIVGWRWADFGRIFEWFLLGWLWWKFSPVKSGPPSLKSSLILVACLVFFLTPTALLYMNLSAHRYFLPGFLGLHLLLFHWLVVARMGKFLRKIVFSLLIIGLATGNLWIYPHGISMGWDATLAHLPYHHLHAEMLKFIDENRIDRRAIGTAFPNINSGEILYLNGDNRSFSEFDLKQNKYVLISNVYNDLSAEDYQYLKQNWLEIKYTEQAGVWIALFQKQD